MAVVGEAKEKALSREKRITKQEHWYKRTWIVESNRIDEDPNYIEGAFGLPKYGYHYVTDTVFDLSAFAYSFNCKQIAPFFWEVDVEYSNDESKTGGGGRGAKNPLREPPSWSWGGYSVKRVVTGQSVWGEISNNQDPSTQILLDSTGILNSAKEPYVPPAEIDWFIPTLTFKRNEPTFNHRYMLYYVNGVNKTKWQGWWKRTVKVANVSGVNKIVTLDKKKFSYWEVTYTLHFNKETWDIFLLDQGSYYFEGGFSTGTKKPHMVKGTPQLTLLTSNGDRSTSIARYNRYRVLTEVEFNKLMIPIIR